MSKIAIKGNESGTATFTIEAPATNTNRVLELPDEAGKILTDVGVPTSAMPAGSVIQVVQGTTSTIVTTTVQNTWVTTNLSQSITPLSTNSKILVLVQQNVVAFGNGDLQANFGLFRDSTLVQGALSFDDLRVATINTSWAFRVSISYLDSPSTTSSVTYSTAISKRSTAVSNVNASSGGDPSSIILMEIAA